MSELLLAMDALLVQEAGYGSKQRMRTQRSEQLSLDGVQADTIEQLATDARFIAGAALTLAAVAVERVGQPTYF